jgi:hypothetical protein
MTTIITITANPVEIDGTHFYDYSNEDRILKNIMNDNHEIFYAGQNQGIHDFQLIESVESNNVFRVYYRKTINTPFIYLGHTTYSSIIQVRTLPIRVDTSSNERLQIKLVIPAENIENTMIHTNHEGYGRYKKALLEHSGFNTDVNLNIGFYRQ